MEPTKITTHELVLIQNLKKDYDFHKKILIQEIINEIIKENKILKHKQL
tara:strand:- start:41 stop:187 length:147 start_codon:yes stop_codon:yes gene_type:complete